MNQPVTDRFDLMTRLASATAFVSERIRSLPVSIRLPLILPALTLALFFGVTRSGPWAWGESIGRAVDLGWLFGWLCALTVLLLVCLGPVIALAVWLAERRSPRADSTLTKPARVEVDASFVSPVFPPSFGDRAGEHSRMTRGRYGAWFYVVLGFLAESALLGFPLGFVTVLVVASFGGSEGKDVTWFLAGQLGLGPIAAYFVFRDRFRTIEAFSSRYCSGAMDLSIAYVPIVVFFYANYRGLLKFRGR